MALQQYIQDYKTNALPEIELQRRLLREQINNQAQQERDAMTRQLARMGGGPSGAAIRAQSELEDKIAQRQNQAEMGLMAADIQTKRQMQEAEKQRQFATSERMAGQEFGAGEAAKQRQFQQGLTNQDLAFRNKVFKAENSARIKQMDIQQQQFAKQMAMEKDALEFNKQVAQWQMNQPTDLFGSLFGSAFSPNKWGNSLSGIGKTITGAFGF